MSVKSGSTFYDHCRPATLTKVKMTSCHIMNLNFKMYFSNILYLFPGTLGLENSARPGSMTGVTNA